MQRLIRSFNTLTDELREKLQEQYPDGIDNSHIRAISTAKGETLRVIELRTSEAIYLIKINPESRAEIEEFLDQDEGAAAVSDDIEADGLEGGDEEKDDADDAGEEEDADEGEDDDADEDDGGDEDGADDDED
ncbi:MAG TPA: DNA primase [Flavobacteriales bacterium]|nr:DNA primase [Flavobacteriales bacterium]HMR28811.1 DNA primase [Flavobacteriales bacterium]